MIQPLLQHFEATQTLPSPTVSSAPISNDDETVVVENPEFRKLNVQSQVTFKLLIID